MLLRNTFYDRGIFSSRKYDLPVIAVGNLSMGGTGKSPMVEYLVDLLKNDYRVATLSRGYKRKSKGFHLLDGQETATEVGDEPLQFKQKFPEVLVAVDEDRRHGIERLLKETNKPEIILLDDAFQHRKVTAGFYILLTSYSDLYLKDLVLPAGNLREPSSGAKRANVIVVTKCPMDLDPQEQEVIKEKIQCRKGQQVYFTSIGYSETILGRNKKLQLKELQKCHFTLVTGIANPAPLVEHLQNLELKFDHKSYKDHHNFTEEEIKTLQHEELILTTEKDYMRLKNEISREKIFYLPINQQFLGGKEHFNLQIEKYVEKK